MEFEDIIYAKKEGVAKITINRPKVLNALRSKTYREMTEALEDADFDPEVGVIVITGAGDRSFSTGGDARETGKEGGYIREKGGDHESVHQLIREIPKPVIAAVNGYAVGAGNVLQMLCDLTIASETARFSEPGPIVGSLNGCPHIALLVGEKKAKEISFLGRMYTAHEALEMGLINNVVPSDKLEEEIDAWCKEILRRSPTALAWIKTEYNATSAQLWGINSLTGRFISQYWKTEESREGRQAYLEKRPPDFSRFRG